MILADTSIWIDHLRAGVPRLAELLETGSVVSHPFVIGELACGNLRERTRILGLMGRLPASPSASDAEVLAFIEHRALMGRGIGYIDTHLLASVALARDVRLWTRDRRLSKVAAELGLGILDRD